MTSQSDDDVIQDADWRHVSPADVLRAPALSKAPYVPENKQTVHGGRHLGDFYEFDLGPTDLELDVDELELLSLTDPLDPSLTELTGNDNIGSLHS